VAGFLLQEEGMIAVLLKQVIALLTEIRDLLKARPLHAVPYEQVAAMMDDPPYDPLAGMRGGWADAPGTGTGTELAAAIPLPPARPAGSLHVSGPNGELPDFQGTPGALNDQVTEATIKDTIAVGGWTATVRPPVSYTNALKIQVMREYNLTGDPSEFELDHCVPLCVGGHPTSQLNLWAQRRTGINGAPLKDLTEILAQHAILNGLILLSDARQGFMTNWLELHTRLTTNPKVMHLMMAMKPPEEEP